MEKNPDLERRRPSVTKPERKEEAVMSRGSMDSFLSFLESAGWTKQIIGTYRCCLERLYVFLPDDKTVSVDTLRQFHRDWATRDKIHAEVAAQVKEIYESLLHRGMPFTT